jgi:hypothetical protein
MSKKDCRKLGAHETVSDKLHLLNEEEFTLFKKFEIQLNSISVKAMEESRRVIYDILVTPEEDETV